MSHNRKLIRDAVVALLTNATDAGANVYANRETAAWASEIPAITVNSKTESANPRDMSSRTYIRDLTLEINLMVSNNESIDDNIDAIAIEVESIMQANPSLSGTALSCIYQSTDITLDASGESEKGLAVLTYQVQYIQ